MANDVDNFFTSNYFTMFTDLFFIVILGYTDDVIWAWYAISASCIIAGIIAYLMRLYFVNQLKEIE